MGERPCGLAESGAAGGEGMHEKAGVRDVPDGAREIVYQNSDVVCGDAIRGPAILCGFPNVGGGGNHE